MVTVYLYLRMLSLFNMYIKNRHIGLAPKILGAVIIIVLILSLLIPFFAQMQFEKMYKENLSNEAVNIAKTIAAVLNSSDLLRDELYNGQLYAMINRIIQNTKLRHLYIVSPLDDTRYNCVIDAFYSLEDHGKPAHLFAEAILKSELSDKIAGVFETGNAVVDEKYIKNASRYIDTILGFAPVVDSADTVIAVVAAAVYTEGIAQTINKYIVNAYLMVFAFNICGMIFYFFYMRRILIRPLLKIRNAANSIAQRDTSFILDVHSNDEIGEIAYILDTDVRNTFDEIKIKNAKINESIQYARRLQKSILPSTAQMEKIFSSYCILWDPRDIVSGDFYWANVFEKGCVFVLADCTGHGVPGALMTMMANAILTNCINEETYQFPKKIIERLDIYLSQMLRVRQGEDTIRDGLDAAVLYIANNGIVKFSSTNISLFTVSADKVTVTKGQRRSIGDGNLRNVIQTFEFTSLPNTSYFLSTDGLFDQIGGIDNLPFGFTRVKDILLEAKGAGVDNCVHMIQNALDTYMGNQMRRDDITLVAFTLGAVKND